MSTVSSTISHGEREKRAVAKKACLACREKKIKCDGEIQYTYPVHSDSRSSFSNATTANSTTYKTCSNCIATGIECVFVPSKRGGRRKRKSFQSTSISTISNDSKNYYHNGHSTVSPKTDAQNIKYTSESYINQPNQQQGVGSTDFPPYIDQRFPPYYANFMYPGQLPFNPNYQQQWQGYSYPNSQLSYPYPPPLPHQQAAHPIQNITPHISHPKPSKQDDNQSVSSSAVSSLANENFTKLKPKMQVQPPSILSPQNLQQQSQQSQKSQQPPQQYSHQQQPQGNYLFNYADPQQFMPQFSNYPNYIPAQQMYQPPQSQSQSQSRAQAQVQSQSHYQSQRLSQAQPQAQLPSQTQQYTTPTDNSSLLPGSNGNKERSPSNYSLKRSSSQISSTESNQKLPLLVNQPQNIIDSENIDNQSVSLAPSDSVTMIGMKQKLKQKKQEEAGVAMGEIPSTIYEQKQSQSKQPPKIIKEENVPTVASSQSLSSTEHWVKAQSDSKRKYIECENEKKSNKKKKKYESLKLNVEMPPMLSEELLFKFGLPDFETLYKLIGIYYKYVHPSYLILPNMTAFVQNLNIGPDTMSILSAMFRLCVRYVSDNEIRDPKWLNEFYWRTKNEEWDDKLSYFTRLLVLSLTCTRADDEQIKDCAELINYISFAGITEKKWKDTRNWKRIASNKQVLERELYVRVLWSVYKCQLFRRVSFGYPYDPEEGEENYLKFNYKMELPLPDTKYYKDSENIENFKNEFNKYLTISEINLTNPDSSRLYDSACLIISCHIMEEVVDCISNKTLLPTTILKISKKLHKLYQVHSEVKHLQPYQLETHPKKDPHIVINTSNFLSTFINRLTLLLLSIAQCRSLLLYSPKSSTKIRSQVNLFEDYSAESLKPDPSLILEKNSQIFNMEKKQAWSSFLQAIESSLDMVTLLELGDGVCSTSLLGTKPLEEVFETVVGPCCSGSGDVEKWCEFNTWTNKVSDVRSSNQGWVQMPSFVVWGMIQAWGVLASLAVSLNTIDLKATNGEKMNKPNTVNSVVNSKGSESEDEDNCQITIGAKRVEDDTEVVKSNALRFSIINRETDEILADDIQIVGKCFIDMLDQSDGKLMIGIVEKLKLIRKYLGVLEGYYGDCKLAGLTCDKVIDYVLELIKSH